MNLLDDGYISNLVFPFGVDLFLPELFNDVTVVNRFHVTDLRKALCSVENALVGITLFPYDGTNIIEDGYNIKLSLETLDRHLFVLESQLGFIFDGVDGYAGRIDRLEDTLQVHREEAFETDADGYSVHGVDGYVVGTENFQILENKKVDSGTAHVGPKLIARSSLADVGNDQIQVMGSDSTSIVASINWRGDAYFAGDITVEGARVIKGMDVVQNSLTVEGSSYLGNNASVDVTRIKGNTDIEGALTVTDNLSILGSDVLLGNNTGILDLNFNQVNISQDAYVGDSLMVSGSTILGDGSGDSHTITGSILHTQGVIHSSGEFRALGTKFRVESDQTTIETGDFVVMSANTQIGDTVLEQNGNIVSDGYLYQFGDPSTISTNSFVINAVAMAEDLIVTNDIQISTGKLITPVTETGSLTATGSVKIVDGSEGVLGHVWTSTDTAGNGAWRPPVRSPWVTVIVDGYTVVDAYGDSNPLVPLGFYDSTAGEEVFVQTDAYGSFTINLPPGSLAGDRVRFTDYNGSWSSLNKGIVFPASGTINGSGFLELDDTLNGWAEVVFNGTNWRVLS